MARPSPHIGQVWSTFTCDRPALTPTGYRTGQIQALAAHGHRCGEGATPCACGTRSLWLGPAAIFDVFCQKQPLRPMQGAVVVLCRVMSATVGVALVCTHIRRARFPRPAEDIEAVVAAHVVARIDGGRAAVEPAHAVGGGCEVEQGCGTTDNSGVGPDRAELVRSGERVDVDCGGYIIDR